MSDAGIPGISPGKLTDWRVRAPGLGMILITLVYIAMEATYHRGLIDLLSSPDTTRAQLDAIEWLGKGLAGFGLTLVLSRIFRMGPILAAMTLAASIYAVDRGFDYLLDNLSPETRVQGFWLATHRQGVMAGEIALPDGASASEMATKLSLAHVALIRFADQESQVGIMDAAQARQYRVLDKARQDIRAGWPNYARDMRELKRAWRKYQAASNKLSRSKWRRLGERQFRSKSGGIRPYITDEETFVAELAESNLLESVKVKAMRERVILPAFAGVPPVYGREVPLNMDKQTYTRFFESALALRANQLIPTIETVSQNQAARDADSAVFIPPLSLTLSTLSVLINTALIASAILLWLFGAGQTVSVRVALAAYSIPLLALLIAWSVGTHPFPERSALRSWQVSAASAGIPTRLWVDSMTMSPNVYGLGELLDAKLGLGRILDGLGKFSSPTTGEN